MYSEFEKKYSRALHKLLSILLILVFLVISIPFFFFYPDVTFGHINIVGATITIVFSPFLFFGLSRYIKNRDASILEALRANDKTFKIPPHGHNISLSQLVFGISFILLLPIYFFTIHSYLVIKAVNKFEIDVSGIVIESKDNFSEVMFINSGKKYVLKVPDSIDTGKLVHVCLPPNGDVSKARIFTVRGPHITEGKIVMGGMHFILSLSFFGVLAIIFTILKSKNL